MEHFHLANVSVDTEVGVVGVVSATELLRALRRAATVSPIDCCVVTGRGGTSTVDLQPALDMAEA